MSKPHNKIELDHAYILDEWRKGRSSDDLAFEHGVSQIVISRHIKEASGDNYESILNEHWRNLAQKRVIARSGKKTSGGARWFTPEEEKNVVQFYIDNECTYDEVADKFECSRIVIKKLIIREVPADIRRSKQSTIRKGRRIVEYIKLVCPVCGKVKEIPPWKSRQGDIYCSVKCKGVATQGEKCFWLYGKIKHTEGHWFTLEGNAVWLRSSWEYGVAAYLHRQGRHWWYEPKTFEMTSASKNITYTPDFYLPQEDLYIEVKGYWYKQYKQKYDIFIAEYPHIKIEVWDKSKLISLGIVNKRHYLTPEYTPEQTITQPRLFTL